MEIAQSVGLKREALSLQVLLDKSHKWHWLQLLVYIRSQFCAIGGSHRNVGPAPASFYHS